MRIPSYHHTYYRNILKHVVHEMDMEAVCVPAYPGVTLQRIYLWQIVGIFMVFQEESVRP